MTKEEWEKAYESLNELHGQFYSRYNNYRNGKNNAIRIKAEDDAREIIKKASEILLENLEIYKLYEGNNNIERPSGSYALGAFEILNNFDSEIDLLLIKMRHKIKSFE